MAQFSMEIMRLTGSVLHGNQQSAPSRKAQVEAELTKIKAAQTSLMQQIQDRHAEGRPRLAILDDRLDELEVKREQLARELATVEEPTEDFQGKIEKLKTQFNPANIRIAIRKLIFLARNNADGAVKQRLMPIVRDLIQTVVIGKTPGHQPASHAGAWRHRPHHGIHGCDRCPAAAVLRFRPERSDDAPGIR
jgi:chaperonin cofactor prefoldin